MATTPTAPPAGNPLLDFGERVKAKYPQYASRDTLDLANRFLQKYPVYLKQFANEEFARQGLPAATSPGDVGVTRNAQAMQSDEDIMRGAFTKPQPFQSFNTLSPQDQNRAIEIGKQVSGIEGWPKLAKGIVGVAALSGLMGPEAAVRQVGSDVTSGHTPGFHEINQAAGGAMQASTPLILGAAAANPAATALGLGAGWVGSKAAGWAANKLGASPDVQETASMLGGLAGAIPGGAMGHAIDTALPLPEPPPVEVPEAVAPEPEPVPEKPPIEPEGIGTGERMGTGINHPLIINATPEEVTTPAGLIVPAGRSFATPRRAQEPIPQGALGLGTGERFGTGIDRPLEINVEPDVPNPPVKPFVPEWQNFLQDALARAGVNEIPNSQDILAREIAGGRDALRNPISPNLFRFRQRAMWDRFEDPVVPELRDMLARGEAVGMRSPVAPTNAADAIGPRRWAQARRIANFRINSEALGGPYNGHIPPFFEENLRGTRPSSLAESFSPQNARFAGTEFGEPIDLANTQGVTPEKIDFINRTRGMVPGAPAALPPGPAPLLALEGLPGRNPAEPLSDAFAGFAAPEQGPAVPATVPQDLSRTALPTADRLALGQGAIRLPASSLNAEDAIRAAGFEPKGRMEGVTPDKDLVLFDDPKTGSTLAMPAGGVTPEAVAQHVADSRAKFGLTPEGKKVAVPQEEVVPREAKPESQAPPVNETIRPTEDRPADEVAARTEGEQRQHGSHIGLDDPSLWRNFSLASAIANVPGVERSGTGFLVPKSESSIGAVLDAIKKNTSPENKSLAAKLRSQIRGQMATPPGMDADNLTAYPDRFQQRLSAGPDDWYKETRWQIRGKRELTSITKPPLNEPVWEAGREVGLQHVEGSPVPKATFKILTSHPVTYKEALQAVIDDYKGIQGESAAPEGKKAAVPEAASTAGQSPSPEDVVKQAGYEVAGRSDGFVHVRDPKTGAVIGVPEDKVTPENIRRTFQDARRAARQGGFLSLGNGTSQRFQLPSGGWVDVRTWPSRTAHAVEALRGVPEHVKNAIKNFADPRTREALRVVLDEMTGKPAGSALEAKHPGINDAFKTMRATQFNNVYRVAKMTNEAFGHFTQEELQNGGHILAQFRKAEDAMRDAAKLRAEGDGEGDLEKADELEQAGAKTAAEAQHNYDHLTPREKEVVETYRRLYNEEIKPTALKLGMNPETARENYFHYEYPEYNQPGRKTLNPKSGKIKLSQPGALGMAYKGGEGATDLADLSARGALTDLLAQEPYHDFLNRILNDEGAGRPLQKGQHITPEEKAAGKVEWNPKDAFSGQYHPAGFADRYVIDRDLAEFLNKANQPDSKGVRALRHLAGRMSHFAKVMRVGFLSMGLPHQMNLFMKPLLTPVEDARWAPYTDIDRRLRIGAAQFSQALGDKLRAEGWDSPDVQQMARIGSLHPSQYMYDTPGAGSMLDAAKEIMRRGGPFNPNVGHERLFNFAGPDMKTRMQALYEFRDMFPDKFDADGIIKPAYEGELRDFVNHMAGNYNPATYTPLQNYLSPALSFAGWQSTTVPDAIKYPFKRPTEAALLYGGTRALSYGLTGNPMWTKPGQIAYGYDDKGNIETASLPSQAGLIGRMEEGLVSTAMGHPQRLLRTGYNMLMPGIQAAIELGANREYPLTGSDKKAIDFNKDELGQAKDFGQYLAQKFVGAAEGPLNVAENHQTIPQAVVGTLTGVYGSESDVMKPLGIAVAKYSDTIQSMRNAEASGRDWQSYARALPDDVDQIQKQLDQTIAELKAHPPADQTGKMAALERLYGYSKELEQAKEQNALAMVAMAVVNHDRSQFLKAVDYIKKNNLNPSSDAIMRAVERARASTLEPNQRTVVRHAIGSR